MKLLNLFNPAGLALMAMIAVAAGLVTAIPVIHEHLPLVGGVALLAAGNVLDVFKSNAFSVISLTDAINKMPFVPGRAGQAINWNEKGVPTTSIMIEEVNGVLRLVNPTPRGGPGTTRPKPKRTARQLAIPHYEVNDTVMADEVQGVREFGQEQQTRTVQGVVSQKQQEHVQMSLDPTLEYQRIGAIKGNILNADGSTLYNLFDEFGVSAPADVQFTFGNADDGSIRGKCDQIVRSIARALGGLPYVSVGAFAGDNWWDGLVKSKEVRATYLNQSEASQLRNGTAFQAFNYGGITFENYRGGVGANGDADGAEDETGMPFIDPDECRFFVIGAPGLFRTVYGPADYVETVNTIGLPRYSKIYPMDNDKGVNLDSQMNALSYCTRPRTLIRGTHA